MCVSARTCARAHIARSRAHGLSIAARKVAYIYRERERERDARAEHARRDVGRDIPIKPARHRTIKLLTSNDNEGAAPSPLPLITNYYNEGPARCHEP